MHKRRHIICFVFFCLSLDISSQTDTIIFNSVLDKLEFGVTTIQNINELLGKNRTVKKGLMWACSIDSCNSTGLKFTYKVLGLTLVLFPNEKHKKNINTLYSISLDSSSNAILNNKIKIKATSINDVKKLYGEPWKIKTIGLYTELSYSPNRGICFYFNKNDILYGVSLNSKKIKRKAIEKTSAVKK